METSESPYRVSLVLFQSGERFPMLVDRSSGVPLCLPTVYSITDLRARNRATNTIAQALRAIMILYLFGRRHGVDVDDRIHSGSFFNLGEIDALAREVRASVRQLTEIGLGEADGASLLERPRVVALERHRQRMTHASEDEINLEFAANRLRYIRDYLCWLGLQRFANLSRDGTAHVRFETGRQHMRDAINARIPSGHGRSSVGAREGLPQEMEDALLASIDPKSSANPWRGEHVRQRNQLIVLWGLNLGVRRGELMGVQIPDIDFGKQEVLIRRRADDVADPRLHQPNAKTRDRRLPLTTEIAELTHRYVTHSRVKLSGARKHYFLFVADKTGSPMSSATLTKVYSTLRSRALRLPEDLSMHVLRHTWNDRFSELMESRKVSPDQEQKLRSYLMGWSETSGTAAVYTRRYVRKRARDVSLDLQRKMIGKQEHDDTSSFES